MNKILQVILGIVILIHLMQVVLLLVSFPLFYSNTRLIQTGPDSKLERRYAVNAGSLVFARDAKTAANETSSSAYVGYKHLLPSIKMNNEYFLNGKNGQMVKVEFDSSDQAVLAPVSDKKFSFLIVVAFALLLVYTGTVVYLSTQLFKFAGETGKQQFFTLKNRRRLQQFGWFILGFGLCSYLFDIFSVSIIEGITGYRGILKDSSGGFQQPYWLISGLLLLIIANAFGKGLELQKEQDYTI